MFYEGKKIRNKFMIANRNTASLECDITLQFASTTNIALPCYIHTF